MIIMLMQLPPDTTTVAYQLTRAVEGMSERILSYAIPLAAVGALAMALWRWWRSMPAAPRAQSL